MRAGIYCANDRKAHAIKEAMMVRNEQQAYEVARKMILRVLDMEPGDRTTVARLAHEIEPGLLEERPGNTLFDDPMLDVTEALFDLAADEGDLLLDMSEHDGKIEGLPFNLDFIVRRRVSGKRLNVDELLEKLEWLYFTIGGCSQGRQGITFRKGDDHAWVQMDDQEDCFIRPQEKIGDDRIDTLRHVVKNSGALTWNETYWAPVLDGTKWELQLRFNDGTYFESAGNNACPTGFNVLIDGLTGLGLKAEFYDYEKEWID